MSGALPVESRHVRVWTSVLSLTFPEKGQLIAPLPGLGDACEGSDPGFVRGDSNRDGSVNIADPINSLNFLFGPTQITCMLAADANDDDRVNIADPIWTIGFLFLGGPPPPPPYPNRGFDVITPGSLTCDSSN